MKRMVPAPARVAGSCCVTAAGGSGVGDARHRLQELSDPMDTICRGYVQARARGRAARCRLRRCLLRSAGVEEGRPKREAVARRHREAAATASRERVTRDVAAGRRDATAAAPVPRTAALGAAGARAHAEGRAAVVRRGVEGALRRGRADATPSRTSRRSSTALEKRFPGTGPLVERYDACRRPFVIPRDKLDAVFQRAIDACRERTLAARDAARRRELHRRVRDEQVVERLQLVSGRTSAA